MNNSKMMMIVMIVMMLLLIGVVGVGVFFIMGKLNATAELSTEGVTTTRTKEPETYKLSELTTHDLKEPISVNLLDSADGSEHAIRISVSVAIVNNVKKESEEVLLLVENNETVIRDLCNVALRSKTKEDLSKNADGITALKEEILTKLQAKFSTDLIYEVYVGDIYWQ